MLAMSLLTPIAKVYRAYALLSLEETQARNDTSTARNKDTKANKQKATSTGGRKKKSKAPNTDDSESVCSNPSVSTACTTASSARGGTSNTVEFFRAEAWGKYVKSYMNDLKILWAREPVAVHMIVEGATAMRLSSRFSQSMGGNDEESLFANYIPSNVE